MSIRCASFRGHPEPGHEDGFAAFALERLVPLRARFPDAEGARVLGRAESDVDEPRPDVVPAIRPPTRDAIALGAASEERYRGWALTADDFPLPIGEVVG